MAWKAGIPKRAWRVAAGVLMALALAGCQRPAQGAADIPHTPIPKTDPRFSMELREGRIHYQGVVADEAARLAVMTALEAGAGAGAGGSLEVDARTLPAAWAPGLGGAAEALRQSGGRLDFTGRRIELHGELDPEQRATLHRRLQRLYPGYALVGALAGADPRLALPDPGDQAGLLIFLNTVPIRFEANSGMLAQSGIEAVARAARGMHAAGSSTPVQALIQPGAGPASDETRALGQQRVDALLTQFALRGVLPPRITAHVAPTAGAHEDQVQFVAAAPAAAPED